MEKILDRERRAPAGGLGAGPSGNGDAPPGTTARASEAVGVSAPAGGESGSQLQTVRNKAAQENQRTKKRLGAVL